MPLDLQIIRAAEFVRLGAHGYPDFEASKAALRELANACHKRGVDRALLDLREFPILPRPRFTPTKLAALVETFQEAGFTRQQRLAVLYRTDPHHGARMFAFIGAMRGWQVRAFADFEQALLWLSKQDSRRLEPGAQEVPVQVATRRIEVRRGVSRDGPERSGRRGRL